MKPCHPLVWLAPTTSFVQPQASSTCHIGAYPGQKMSTSNGAKNIALPTSMVVWRIKNLCGQAISVRYPVKESHDHQRVRLTAIVWWFLRDHQGPDTQVSWKPYGSTKTYSQRPTIFFKDFIPPTRLSYGTCPGWLVWNIQVCFVGSKISLQPLQFYFKDSVKHLISYYHKWVYRQHG